MANLTNPGNYQLTTMGQTGSVYHKGNGDPVVAPEGKAFDAITMITNTTFETKVTGAGAHDGGLVAENPADSFGTSGTGYTSTGTAEISDSLTFPAGITIYGRFKSIDVKTGDVIAYLA